jgi:WD40 repeat protein
VIVNVDTGENLQTLRGHSGPVNAVVFDPLGLRAYTASDDNTIRAWTVSSGMPVALPAMRHNDKVLAIAISSDGKTLTSTGADRMIKSWTTEDGLEIPMAAPPGMGPRTGIAYSPKGTSQREDRYLASSDTSGAVSLLDAVSGAQHYASEKQDGPIVWVGFSADCKYVISATATSIFFRNLNTGEPHIKIEGRQGIRSLAVLDSTIIISSSVFPDGKGGAIDFWDENGNHNAAMLFYKNGEWLFLNEKTPGTYTFIASAKGHLNLVDEAGKEKVLKEIDDFRVKSIVLH